MGITEETPFYKTAEVTHQDTPINAEGGSGGDDMDSWGSEQTIVDNLLVGSYTNASSYPIPAYISEGTDSFDTFEQVDHGSSETGVEVGYTFLGTRVSGTVLLADDPEADNPSTYAIGGVSLYTTDGENDFTASADPSSGEYKLPVGGGGEYTVEARHPLLDTVTVDVSLADGESQPDTDLLLEVPSGGAGGILRRRIG